jgi:hypothetical protein
MNKPFVATRIAAPPTKSGRSRAGWLITEIREEGNAIRHGFVWQSRPGADELFREYHADTINIIGGFEVTVKEYQKVLRSIGFAV